MRRFQSLFLSLVLLLPASGAPPEGAQAPDTARGRGGMVVAAEPFAAEAGLEILRQDGNAVDAAVAVAFALAVTYPQAGNLGGGGFMLIRRADGQADFVDYREMAPGAATWNMYLDQDGNLSPEASTQGWRAAGIPGTVAGLELALRTHGTLALGEVMAPAIRLAEEGFPVSERLAEDLKAAADKLSRDPESRKIFLRHGKTYQAGDTLVQKDLARTLKKIAEKGALEFYRGQTAQKIVRASEKGGGLFTLDDLAGYEAKRRQPLAGSFGGYEILTAPPPSSGGVALLETLNMLETLLEPSDRPQEPLTIHLIAEALRRAFADRARYLADTDFAEVPVAGLINKDYAAAFRDSIDTRKASASADLSHPDPLRYQEKAGRQPKPAVVSVRESDQTTHFSVVDAEGNAVANTYTVNSWFGNGITVPGLGFLLNNEMDDFSVNPGRPNALFELVQSDGNKIEPGKRPLSSMTPTIVTREGETILVLGSPGGPRIISAVIEVLLNRLHFGDDLALAVARPRFHHQWLPDAVFVEEGVFSSAQLEALRARGHSVRGLSEISTAPRPAVGQVNAIERDPETGELYGVADPRRRGVARGY